MPKLPENNTGTFERMPAGNHLAVCYEVIDMGTQETKWGPKHQLWIGWEAANEHMEDGRPFVIGQRYTLSANEKSNLRAHLESWRGKAFTEEDYGNFEIGNVIGAACFLNVVHEMNGEKTYANIEAVAPLPKGVAPPQLQNEPVLIDLDETFDLAAFNRLSDFMKTAIAASPEYQALRNGRSDVAEAAESDDNPTPF